MRKDFLGHDPAGHAGGTYCSTTVTQTHNTDFAVAIPVGGYVYAHTPRFLLFAVGGAKSSIIVAPGQTKYTTGRENDATTTTTTTTIRRRRSHTFGDSPGGKIPITQ